MQVDLAFINGTIITVDDKRPHAAAVAVHNGKIAHVGSEDEVRAVTGLGTRVIDLAGRALLPGLNDNHNHPMSFGEQLGQIDASPGAAPTLAALQDAFRSAAAKGEGWLIARGYDD